MSTLLGYCGEVAERFERAALCRWGFREREEVKGGEEGRRGGRARVARPDRAGKSTTVGMLITTILPFAGSAPWPAWIAAEPLAARRLSCEVFQESVLVRAPSCRRNL